MLNGLRKYSGVIFFYLVIVFMIILVSSRFQDLSINDSNQVIASIIEEQN